VKPDIINNEDIAKMITSFYDKVRADEVIGAYFNDIMSIDWEKHIPLICSFFENVLFYTGNYEGNPLKTHQRINAIHNTPPEYFERWIMLFNQAVDELFNGDNATKVKEKAASIASVMQQRL
jgi:hemoglobin